MKFVLLCWLAALINSGLSKRYFRVLEDSKGKVLLRFPEVLRVLSFSYDFSDLILIDKDCGKRRKGCANYCDSPRFSQIYCDFVCQQVSPQLAYQLCPSYAEYSRFDGKRSVSAKLINATEWRWQVAGFRPVYGYLWEAIAQFTGMANGKPRETTALLNIVSASAFDIRLLSDTIGVFGLGPGADSPIGQFVRIHRLSRPALTVALRTERCRYNCKFTKQETLLLNERIFTIGAVDGSECADWVFVNSTAPDKWAFEIDAVDFMGIRLNGKFLGLLSHSIPDLLFGEDAAAQIQKSGIATTYNQNADKWELSTECDDGPTAAPIMRPVIFRVGASTLRFGRPTLLEQTYFRGSRRMCRLRTKVNRLHPHSHLNVWVLGTEVLKEHCIALDYQRNRIGFGRKRGMAFPYN